MFFCFFVCWGGRMVGVSAGAFRAGRERRRERSSWAQQQRGVCVACRGGGGGGGHRAPPPPPPSKKGSPPPLSCGRRRCGIGGYWTPGSASGRSGPSRDWRGGARAGERRARARERRAAALSLPLSLASPRSLSVALAAADPRVSEYRTCWPDRRHALAAHGPRRAGRQAACGAQSRHRRGAVCLLSPLLALSLCCPRAPRGFWGRARGENAAVR